MTALLVLGVAAVFVAGSLAFVAIGPSQDAGGVVDGFPLGAPIACAQLGTDQCATWVSLAGRAFDARQPAHPAVASSAVFNEDLSNAQIWGSGVLHARSGRVIVVVFRLVDGSRAAAGVYCPETAGACQGLALYPH